MTATDLLDVMARTRHPRAWVRRRIPVTTMDSDLWMPPGISTSMWQHSLNDLCHEPSPPRSYEDLSDNNVLTPAFSAFSLGRADGVAQANRARGARRYQGAVPFERAVDTLCQALHSAMKHCKGIKDHFDKTIEASSIALWAPPRAVDALWTMNVEWDGVDRSRRAHFPEQQPAPEVVTFQGIIARFENAMKAMAHCSGPRLDYLEYADHKLSPEVFRNTLSKLKVTLKGVEELMQSVRKDRGLMEPLIKDLMAATQLLDDIGPLWVPRPRTTAAKSRRWMQEGDDHERPWYRGD
ncbi:hypothetical protein BAUCODRAFT_505304 [Baudoinia panamericana UAMH 10762]|uniref:Uncharacterized protein n=1 Tax=Baudoinia panamericana (strain UAMH 10762) TaxID=717646 RepID=M2MGQ3_BAUPA|nr:uncharacterized protein BAUCODRAFT_505304 [Baudoinia panamericana UAMH 10762]EMC95821.1 hypothetical protein BAUCODRAFT_505304 [Baudoinia panamericana UAMH 10762]